MARIPSRTRSAARARTAPATLTPRTLFLAGLGAAQLTRREAERLAGDAASVPQRLRAGADAAVDTAWVEARKLADAALSRVAPLAREAGKLRTRIDAARARGVAEAAKRLNPLLARVGLPAIPAGVVTRATRKAAKSTARKTPSRRAAPAKVGKGRQRRA